jgi:hypothetical protein
METVNPWHLLLYSHSSCDTAKSHSKIFDAEVPSKKSAGFASAGSWVHH